MPNAKTMNIADVLAGVNYPKDQVTVYLDAGIAYEIGKVRDEIDKRNLRGEDVEDLEKDLDALIAEGQENSLTFHITGVPRATRENILKAVMEEFPVKKDFMGRAEQDPQADVVYTCRLWAAMTEKIEHPSGGSMDPEESDIAAFRSMAPDEAVNTVMAAIQDLESGEKAGFEAIVKRHDFLSQP